jgi:hypothetical protein
MAACHVSIAAAAGMVPSQRTFVVWLMSVAITTLISHTTSGPGCSGRSLIAGVEELDHFRDASGRPVVTSTCSR